MDGYIVSLDGSSAPASRPAVEAALQAGSMLWLELHGIDTDTADMLRDVFAFHPVALENARQYHQRPKAENFGDMFSMVGYAATTVGGPLTEVHLFYTDRFLLTVSEHGCDVLDDVRRRLHGARLARIACSNQVDTPCVIGLLRPLIVLPTAGIHEVAGSQLCDVLVHDRAIVGAGVQAGRVREQHADGYARLRFAPPPRASGACRAPSVEPS